MKTMILFLIFLFSFSLYAQEQLQVGVVGYNLEPQVGIPLAGYGSKKRRLPKWDWSNKHPHSFFFKPSEGTRDPIRSKVMALKKGSDKLIFISLDMIGVDRRFVRKLARRLRKHDVKISQLFISATHTHSGPGTLSRNPALSAIATDLYKSKNYYRVLNKVTKSVVQALEKAEPATLYSSSFEAQGIQANKWRHKGEEYFDKTANFLLAKSQKSGLWLGGMLNFAMHGNAMPVADLRYSADILGAFERNIENILFDKNNHQHKPTILFMNAAEGDVKHNGGRSEEIMETLALEFATQAKKRALKIDYMSKVSPEFKYQRRRVKIGWPFYPLKMCMKKGKKGLLNYWVAAKRRKKGFVIPLWPIFPRKSYLSIAQVGDIVMMTWPGEASASLGWKLEKIALSKGHKKAWILGLANDYLTYFTTKDEFFEAAYDSCSSMYGYVGGRNIINYYDWALDHF